LDLVLEEFPFIDAVGETVASIKQLLLTEIRYYFEGFNVGASLWVFELTFMSGLLFLVPGPLAILLSDC